MYIVYYTIYILWNERPALACIYAYRRLYRDAYGLRFERFIGEVPYSMVPTLFPNVTLCTNYTIRMGPFPPPLFSPNGCAQRSQTTAVAALFSCNFRGV